MRMIAGLPAPPDLYWGSSTMWSRSLEYDCLSLLDVEYGMLGTAMPDQPMVRLLLSMPIAASYACARVPGQF